MKRLVFEIKAIRLSLLCSLLLCYGLLPVVNWISYDGVPWSESLGVLLRQAQMLVPLALALPLGFRMKTAVEHGTDEVRHAMGACRRAEPAVLLCLEVLLSLASLPLFLWYARLYGVFFWQEWLRTAVQTFFLCNLGLFIAYLTHLPLAAPTVQVLAGGIMLLFLENAPGPLARTLNIYAWLTVQQPRPWEPMRIAVVFLIGTGFFFLSVRRMRHYLDLEVL
jgi:hypothetical protein